MEKDIFPLGIWDFKELRQKGYCYVDKTKYLYQLIHENGRIDLSRPKGFGKTLFATTMKYLFEGEKELFEGLYIYEKWDWSKKYPVLYLDFQKNYQTEEEVNADGIAQLKKFQEKHDIEDKKKEFNTFSHMLGRVLYDMHFKHGKKVVVIIDGHDKSFLDALSDVKLANKMRRKMAGMHSTLKGSPEYLRFLFVTGETAVVNMSMFSSDHNLFNATLSNKFSDAFGFTEQELDTTFGKELDELDRDQVRRWYGGYRWAGDAKVYNPTSILTLLQKKEYKSTWFESTLRDSLYPMLVDQNNGWIKFDMRKVLTSGIEQEDIFIYYDPDSYDLLALLHGYGYLSVEEKYYEKHHSYYILTMPNHEVKSNFVSGFLNFLCRGKITSIEVKKWQDMLTKCDFAGFATQLGNDLTKAVKALMFDRECALECLCSTFAFLGMFVHGLNIRYQGVKGSYSKDLILFYQEEIFVMHFKVALYIEKKDENLASAIKTLRERCYEEEFGDRGQPIHLLSYVFCNGSKALLGWEAETLSPKKALSPKTESP